MTRTLSIKNLLFFVWTDIIVVGYDPEMADMDNPEGARYGYAAYVVAQDGTGNRMRHTQLFIADMEAKAVERARNLLSRIQKADRDLDVLCWLDLDPAYGSPAYVAVQTEMTPEELSEG